MANTFAGGEFTFTSLFLAADGTPIVPVALPLIHCFYFDANGNKLTFIPPTNMTLIAGTPGRYCYKAIIPDNLTVNTEVYADMSAIDPATSATVVIEQTSTVISNASTGDGIRVAFIKPAGFL